MRRNVSKFHKRLVRSSSKRRQRLLASLTAAGVAGTGALAQADTSTTLTGVMPTVTNTAVPVNHGSNAEATLTWSPPTLPETGNDWDQYAAWDGRGDVYQINNRMTDIKFTPTGANIKITIGSFELDEYAGGGNTSVMWSLTGSSSGLLSSGIWVDFDTAHDPMDHGGRSLVSVNQSGVPGEMLTLAFDHSQSEGFISYLAMDNLAFSSMIVPEPATAVLAWLGVSGLGALAMRRKRK